ncbi:MAG TPA: MFS transporter [Acidobacteriaceae bacterium]|nr:MFS transporter [Acidobacteriaceae bacterium]
MGTLAILRELDSTQRHTVAASFLGWTLDAFDYFLLVMVMPAVAHEFHVDIKQVAVALFLTLAFRPLGALIFGRLADRFGRRRVLMVDVTLYSILGLACAFAPSLLWLLVLRSLFGIAMGGEWGIGASLAMESIPAKARGAVSGLLQEGYAVGYLIAAASYALLFPWFSHFTWYGHPFGWRGMFLVGAVPALLVFYIGGRVEESPAWKQGRALEAKTLPGIGLKRGVMQYAGTFVFLVVLMTGFNAFSHGTQDLYPTFLQRDHGLSARLTGTIAIIYNIGAIAGGMIFGALSERIGRKKAIIAAALLSLPIIPLYALAHSMAALATGAFLMQFMVQGAWGVVPAWLSELSPGPVRATFPGLAYQLGNLISSQNNELQSIAAEHFRTGYGPVLAATVAIVAVYLAIVAAFGRESRGAELTTQA